MKTKKDFELVIKKIGTVYNCDTACDALWKMAQGNALKTKKEKSEVAGGFSKIKIYKDRNENLYVRTGRKIGFMVRISDGTMHDGTTIGEFFLVKEIEYSAKNLVMALPTDEDIKKEIIKRTKVTTGKTDREILLGQKSFKSGVEFVIGFVHKLNTNN